MTTYAPLLSLLLLAVAPLSAQTTTTTTPTRVALGDFGFVPTVDGPTDNRFFGTYCLEAARRFCKDVRLFPDPCVTLSSLRVQVDHVATSGGSRLVGRGALEIDGERGGLTVAGAVTERGAAHVAAHVPGLGVQRGEVSLSADGLELTASAVGETLTLRKDACGNEPPRVELAAPGGPEFEHREPVTLGAEVTDEDEAFPLDRLIFSSNRQGVLTGTRLRGGRTLITSALATGEHRVTLFVIDSGGLIGSGSTVVRIVNQPPTASILAPSSGSAVQSTAPVLLRGRGTDREDGFLSGARFTWEIEPAPDAGFVPVGGGNPIAVTFPEPAPAARARLTVRDAAGQTDSDTVTLRVAEFGGNATPAVAIEQPPQLFDQRFALVAIAGESIRFEATAADLEDPVDELELRWEFFALDGDRIDPNPRVPNPPPVTGDLATDVAFANVGDVAYRAIFTATDRGGASASQNVEIFVLAQPVQ